MGVVDLDDIPSHEYEEQPVFWFDCPGCGKGMKSTWFFLEDGSGCNVCGTEYHFQVISHLEVLVNPYCHEMVVHGADQRIRRNGAVWFPCQGCDESLNLAWFLHDREFNCRECETHHHLEISFNNIGNPKSNQEELCLLCGETTFVELMNTHHISYSPEKVVRVCRECHRRIHKERGYHDDLEPEVTPNASMADLKGHPG